MNKKLEIKKDERGKLIEIFKFPDGQVYYFTLKPGIVRGNHYHQRKEEIFCAIEGEGKITLKNKKTNEIKKIFLSGEKPELINIPQNWTHKVENTGKKELKILAWTNEIYNPDDADTFLEEI